MAGDILVDWASITACVSNPPSSLHSRVLSIIAKTLHLCQDKIFDGIR